MDKKEKKINEFAIDKLLVSVYNKIANWHNDDGSGTGLKQLSFDIISEVAGATFKHLDIPYNGEVKLDKEMRDEAIKFKEKVSDEIKKAKS